MQDKTNNPCADGLPTEGTEAAKVKTGIEVPPCVTCRGTGLVDIGRCPDCLGSGDETTADMAFERFVNGNVAKRLDGDGIEPHLLAAMWDAKLYPWAERVSRDWLADGETPCPDVDALCGANECGGCAAETDAPCESYKLRRCGIEMAAGLYWQAKATNGKP